MRMYYHTTVPIEGAEPPRDTTYYRVGNYFAVTPEVITNNNITLEIAQYIREKAAQGEKLLLAPAGYEVSFKFPADKIIDVYREKSGKLSILNTLSLSLPAEEIANDLGIEPPADVLLIPTAKRMSSSPITSFLTERCLLWHHIMRANILFPICVTI